MADLEPRADFQRWSTQNAPPSGSLPAQIAHKVVVSEWPEMAMDMHYRLLKAYFSENRTVSNWDVLADLVSSIGGDSDHFLSVVQEKREIFTTWLLPSPPTRK